MMGHILGLGSFLGLFMGSRDREDAGRRRGHRSDEDRGYHGSRDDSRDRSNRDHGRRSYHDSRREHSRDRRERDDDDRRYQDPKRGGDNLKQGDAGGGERQLEGKDELPDLYAICRAKVHSIKPFGIFVRLNGYRSHGLVHLSQVSNHEVTQREDSDQVKIQALAAIVGEGEDVWVKIISIKHEEGGSVKIGCSLKHVAQSDGRDLDPNNVHGESQDSRPARRAHEKVTLDAVYNVTCTRCGGHGHLKKECYSTGGRVYELLPEETSDPDLDVRKQEGKPENDGLSGISEQVPLPDSVTTVEEAKALLVRLKAEKKEKKRHRKEDKHKERKHHKKSKKQSSKH